MSQTRRLVAILAADVAGYSRLAFEDMGEQALKNIARPVRVYRVRDAVSKSSSTLAPSVLPLPDKPSIAVLPFANLSGDSEQEYFADGMVEEIITALSRIRWRGPSAFLQCGPFNPDDHFSADPLYSIQIIVL
jgi:hypothetical protein